MTTATAARRDAEMTFFSRGRDHRRESASIQNAHEVPIGKSSRKSGRREPNVDECVRPRVRVYTRTCTFRTRFRDSAECHESTSNVQHGCRRESAIRHIVAFACLKGIDPRRERGESEKERKIERAERGKAKKRGRRPMEGF